MELVDSSAVEMGASADLHIPGKEQIKDVIKELGPFFDGIVVANNGFTPETGLQKLKEGEAKAIAFAKLYVTNPDLTDRILNGHPLNTDYDFSTFYGAGLEDKAKGYTTYKPYQK